MVCKELRLRCRFHCGVMPARLDDRPPFGDLGLVLGSECLWRLLLLGENLLRDMVSLSRVVGSASDFTSCELSIRCPSGPDRGSWRCRSFRFPRGGPDERALDCPSDAAWSRADCTADRERADAEGCRRSRRRHLRRPTNGPIVAHSAVSKILFIDHSRDFECCSCCWMGAWHGDCAPMQLRCRDVYFGQAPHGI